MTHDSSGGGSLTIGGITDEILTHSSASGIYLQNETFNRLAAGAHSTDRLYVALKEERDAATFVLRENKTLFSAAQPAARH